MSNKHQPWSCVCHLSIDGNSSLVLIEHDKGGTRTYTVPQAAASGLEEPKRPVLIGLHQPDRSAILLDPASKRISAQAQLPADAIAAYAYRDPLTDTYWMVSDGDKDTGIDPVSCENGSPVTVINSAGSTVPGSPINTICAGRGHHVVTYTGPSAHAPMLPRRAFLSNLLDGSITVVGNDPADDNTYLKVLNTINLCEAAHEEGHRDRLPNNAYPHGMVFSKVTGKLYNMNNGYGSVVVIDPSSDAIEKTATMKLSSNLLLSPDGRFLIGKGVDRKSDAEHIIGRLTVMDAASGDIADMVNLPNIYPSCYRFNSDGSKLYVTTAATGKGIQKENSKLDRLLIFDSSAMPKLNLIKEIQVGSADCGRRSIAFLHAEGRDVLVFVPNPTDSSVSVLDGISDTVIDTVTLGTPPAEDFNFMYWRSVLHGA